MTNSNLDPARYDPEILELIPHRPPMLLINTIQSLSAEQASSIVLVDELAPFYQPPGIPSWIGLEYMGQTAALIAGYQLREGLVSPHLGFLLGTRQYLAEVDYFPAPSELSVRCEQAALVGESLANFDCTIQQASTDQVLARASLSVFRNPEFDDSQESLETSTP